jgi:hypothetical protein
MAISDDVGYEVLSHYLYSLAKTIDGRKNRVVPYRADDSLLFLLHRAEITEPLFAREDDDSPPPYDKPHYTLCFEFVTEDPELWMTVANTLTREVPFLRGKSGDDATEKND